MRQKDLTSKRSPPLFFNFTYSKAEVKELLFSAGARIGACMI